MSTVADFFYFQINGKLNKALVIDFYEIQLKSPLRKIIQRSNSLKMSCALECLSDDFKVFLYTPIFFINFAIN